MSANKRSASCVGCGGVLQNASSNEPHYVPKPIGKEPLYCQRCHRITHYNASWPQPLDTAAYIECVGALADRDVLVVYVVDVFDIEHALQYPLPNKRVRENVIVVANKRDILPKSLSDAKLTNKLQKQLAQARFKPLDIILTSATKRHGIDRLKTAIQRHANGRDVLFIGMSGTGKSHLANALNASTKTPFTVAAAPGTTQRPLAFSLDGIRCIDTPGFHVSTHMARVLPADLYALYAPREEIKPRSYRLEKMQSLIIGGVARLDHVGAHQTVFILNASADVHVHRTKQARADDVLNRRGSLFAALSDRHDIPELSVQQSFTMRENEDVVFGGFAHVRVLSATDIVIHRPEHVTAFKREALIG